MKPVIKVGMLKASFIREDIALTCTMLPIPKAATEVKMQNKTASTSYLSLFQGVHGAPQHCAVGSLYPVFNCQAPLHTGQSQNSCQPYQRIFWASQGNSSATPTTSCPNGGGQSRCQGTKGTDISVLPFSRDFIPSFVYFE